MFEKNNCKRITGIGAVLVDLLINESDEFLMNLGKRKGGMSLVDDEDIENILKSASVVPQIVPGGAACNTILGIGRLGGEARFIGSRGNDEHGIFYEEQLRKYNVEPVFSVSSLPTGKVLSIITPDAQRSMFTFLGASTELNPENIDSRMFSDTAIAVIEGYLLFNRDLIISALESAKEAGAAIALDLASFEVVENAGDILDDIVKNYVDILIANEDEARAYTNCSNEIDVIKCLSENVSIGVLKLGARGSCISENHEIIKIAPKTGEDIVDTTGAGDLWAAGFLFGLVNGFSLEKSGQIASACGYEVCRVVGAYIPDDGWRRIQALI